MTNEELQKIQIREKERADEFNRKCEEKLKDIPQEFHGAIHYIAYDMGHSFGYDEVYNILSDLAYHLKEPIKKYTERINS